MIQYLFSNKSVGHNWRLIFTKCVTFAIITFFCIGFCKEAEKDSLVVPQKVLMVFVSKVECLDGLSECPDNNTCCKMSDSTFGCCPYQDAECCSDDLHCCPHGSQCVGGG